MTGIIITTVVSLLIIVFIISRSNPYFVISPQFAFTVSFIPSMILLSLFVDKWNLDLDNRTIALIIVGPAVFAFFSFISKKLTTKVRIKVFRSINRDDSRVFQHNISKVISYNKLVIFTIFGLIGMALTLGYIVSFTGSFGGGISLLLRNYRDAYNTESLDMPAIISVASMFATCISYYCVYYYFNNNKVLQGDRIRKILLILNWSPGFIIPLLSGARGGVISYGIYIFAAIFINSAKEIKVQRKAMRIAIIIAIVAVVSLRGIGNFMGRAIQTNVVDYIGMYLSGPIWNLNYTIKTEDIGLFTGFGDNVSYTFAKLLNYLSFRFGIGDSVSFSRSTHMINGLYTGNMYTVYYNLIHDAGYIGSMFLLALTAFLCQLFYSAIRKKLSGHETTYTASIAYTLVYSNLYLSFFNENFFYNVFTNYFLREIIFLMIIDWFVRRVRLR